MYVPKFHVLPKKAQARAEPCNFVGVVITELLLMVPPALFKVEPKMARKQIGAMTLLKAKKYWTCWAGCEFKVHVAEAGVDRN